ncbi:MAG: response regulator [Stenotrophomonas sp.]
MHHANTALPRLLLIEDDPVSRSFLQAVLESLPARVDCSDTAAGAYECALRDQHDLWLIDVNLPDGTGSSLLSRLRQQQRQTPALAHTADTSTALASQLRSDGFIDVLVKPLSREALLHSVRAALPEPPAATTLPNWDEQRALSALNGQHSHIKALRELFMGELPSVRDAINHALANEQADPLRQQLHRLQASCGFVGAVRLGAAAARLQQKPHDVLARQQLQQSINQLLGG